MDDGGWLIVGVERGVVGKGDERHDGANLVVHLAVAVLAKRALLRLRTRTWQ